MSRRYWVVFGIFVLAMITYIDRACIASAKEPIAAELALSDRAMGMVFGAFALGYALAQIPSGWLADRFGPRAALAGVVSAWSFFTALTGAAWSFASLVAIRFLFGIAEAGAFPGSSRAFYNWLPASERGRAHGMLFSGSRVGAALAFPLLAWMLETWQWRVSFLILGGIGIVWAVFWLLLFRNHPPYVVERDPAVEGSQIALRDVLRSGRMLLNMAQYFAGNLTFFICLSWMLPYLRSRYKLGAGEAAVYAMAPLLAGMTANWISGFWVDRMFRSRAREWSRRLPAMIGFALAAAGVLLLVWVDSPAAAVVCFTIATFGADLTLSPSWAFCADIAGKNSGSVSAAMNTVGNVGSFISANAFPWLYGATGSADAYFSLAAALNIAAVACWYAMRSVAPAVRRLSE